MDPSILTYSSFYLMTESSHPDDTVHVLFRSAFGKSILTPNFIQLMGDSIVLIPGFVQIMGESIWQPLLLFSLWAIPFWTSRTESPSLEAARSSPTSGSFLTQVPVPLWNPVFPIHIKSGLGIRVRNPDTDPGGQKWATKIGRKKVWNFMLWSAWCWLLRAEGFFCSLDVLYGGPGINCSFGSNFNFF